MLSRPHRGCLGRLLEGELEMSLLILARHANPEIIDEVHSTRWRLSAEGIVNARKMAKDLVQYAPCQIVSSEERKAQETAEIIAEVIGGAVKTAAGLQEHERSVWPLMSREAFRARVAEIFQQPANALYGPESATAAKKRFVEAVQQLVHRQKDGNLIIVSHGTVMSLFVAAFNTISAEDFWKALGLPAYVVLSMPDFELISSINISAN